ncbi:MAG: amino acid adenylation domain-containing protein [Gemmatimonadaceae bacterium]
MPSFSSLHAMLASVAPKYPNHVAIEDPPDGQISYRDLNALSDRLRDRLIALGVQPGDRVGVYARKSIDAVVAIFGAMKAGAAYVPVDPSAPAWRCAYILNDCSVRAVVLEERFRTAFEDEVRKLGGNVPHMISMDGAGGGGPVRAALDRLDAAGKAPEISSVECKPEDLAYILYTSGSTGKPKGVMLTHGNALAYVDWLSDTFSPRQTDRFSSHAPFHFDLSILDLYLCFKHGGTLILIGSEAGREPSGLAQLIADRRISIWYSAPSILSVLAEFGKLERFDYGSLRIVFFAGEVFPIKYLRLIKQQWTHPRYVNMYGPTETNVCTWFEIPKEIPDDRADPYPIGKVCENLAGKVVDQDGRDLPAREEGELCISGTNVMVGYWNLPEQTSRSFLVDGAGVRWYRTGDIVVLDEADDYVFVGRRDRMVKRRGHRVELGEIEAGLYRHQQIREAAVIARSDGDGGVRIRAFIAMKDGQPGSIIALKKFSAEQLPASMIPDDFVFLDVLPKTSTDKTDYQRLAGM